MRNEPACCERGGGAGGIATCDIFCNVIDNFGDIGVCWRLARQLANEHGLRVRLWVDDLNSLAKLCHEADPVLESQLLRGVAVMRWRDEVFCSFTNPHLQCAFRQAGRNRSTGAEHALRIPRLAPQPLSRLRERGVADLVIEAFGCALPESYIAAMAVQQPQPVWINLEYLSAEQWVEGCHRLPSPHPTLPLVKYFFFPGFTRQTGGLLLEHALLTRRDAFQQDAAQRRAFWQTIGMEMPAAETLKISLFGYENDALADLFDVWVGGGQPVLCLVPEGRILPQVGQYFGDAEPRVGKGYSRERLRVCVLPFVEQEHYDELLWACDVNFVRGEDSCVRAQWAGKPFIWQIYPQHDAVHWSKLQAFLNLYSASLSPSARAAVQNLWQAWNGGRGAGQAASTSSGQAWAAFAAACDELDRHAQLWAHQLAENNLALNLLNFSRKIGTIPPFKIKDQET